MYNAHGGRLVPQLAGKLAVSAGAKSLQAYKGVDSPGLQHMPYWQLAGHPYICAAAPWFQQNHVQIDAIPVLIDA